MDSTPSSRPRCERCTRPLSHCLCAYIPCLKSLTRVIVLQHPDESRHPMNTARLAVLGLRHAELWVGEHFPDLEAVVAQHAAACLLFPVTDASPVFEPASVEAEARTLLVVPDGTWRKARRLIRANPVLQTMPRLGLPAGAPSEYRIRRADEPAALATIEALVRALEQLEPAKDFQPLLRPFRVMVERQIEAMGAEVYIRNHRR